MAEKELSEEKPQFTGNNEKEIVEKISFSLILKRVIYHKERKNGE